MGEVWGAEVGAPTGCLHRARWELAVTPQTPVPVWTLKTTVDSGDQLQSLWVYPVLAGVSWACPSAQLSTTWGSRQG